jgi:hypothetical protein
MLAFIVATPGGLICKDPSWLKLAMIKAQIDGNPLRVATSGVGMTLTKLSLSVSNPWFTWSGDQVEVYRDVT